MSRVVCVTGASGFLGSHLVKLLLEKGYKVHATVRDVNDEKKVDHLKRLPHAQENLVLFEADLDKPESFGEALIACEGVFHAASPLNFSLKNEDDFVKPAVNGTLGVLEAAIKLSTIKKVVYTSSTAAVSYNKEQLPSDHVFNEKDWTPESYLREGEHWYALSKTLAERAAWDFSKKHNLDLVVVNPTLIIGPILQPTMNMSVDVIKQVIDGKKSEIPKSFMAFVDVRDVAEAHVLAYEKGHSGQRFLCISAARPWSEYYQILRETVPASYVDNIPTKLADEEQKPPLQFDVSPLKNLGWNPIDLRTSLVDTVKALHLDS